MSKKKMKILKKYQIKTILNINNLIFSFTAKDFRLLLSFTFILKNINYNIFYNINLIKWI